MSTKVEIDNRQVGVTILLAAIGGLVCLGIFGVWGGITGALVGAVIGIVIANSGGVAND
jgi:hypothetical protein